MKKTDWQHWLPRWMQQASKFELIIWAIDMVLLGLWLITSLLALSTRDPWYPLSNGVQKIFLIYALIALPLITLDRRKRKQPLFSNGVQKAALLFGLALVLAGALLFWLFPDRLWVLGLYFLGCLIFLLLLYFSGIYDA